MFEMAVPGKPLFKFSSDPLYNIHVLLIVNVECMHIFNFEQHGQLAIVNFAQAYKSDKKDYLKMTRPISTLYGMLSHFDNMYLYLWNFQVAL